MHTTYNSLSFKLTVTLQVCDGCALSKAKSCAVRKKTSTRASQPRERVFVDTTGPFPESLIGIWYYIGVVDYYRRYSWNFFTKMESRLPKNIEDCFEKMTSRETSVQYLLYNNAGENQSKLQRVCEKKGDVGVHVSAHAPSKKMH